MVLLLAGLVAGCGEDPAVCQAVDDLQASVADVKDVDLRSDGGLQDLDAALDGVRDDVDAVRSEASDEYADQAAAVKSAFSDLQSSVKDTREGTGTLAATAAAASTFRTAVKTLVEDVRTTC
jgi:hypothetical protein